MRTDGQTDMTKLRVVFRNFTNAPKNWSVSFIHESRHSPNSLRES